MPELRGKQREHPLSAPSMALSGPVAPQVPRSPRPYNLLHWSRQDSDDFTNSTFATDDFYSTNSSKISSQTDTAVKIYHAHQGRCQPVPRVLCNDAMTISDYQYASVSETRTEKLFAQLRYAHRPVDHLRLTSLRGLCSHSSILGCFKPRQQNIRECHHQSGDGPENPQFPNQNQTSDHLTHTDAQGKATMVNVGDKAVTRRTATASARVILGPKAFKLVRANQLSKGDALAVAQLAGIMGAKQTSSLIPLCHPLPLDHATVTVELQEEGHLATVMATCQTTGRTGVEMEALTAVSVAALALYDMCKAVSRDIVITDIKLLSKTGGQRGDFQRTS